MNQVPYHLLTSAERKNPAITKSKVKRTLDYEKIRQEHVANLAELKKKDAISRAKMKLKPIVVSLKVCISLIVKHYIFLYTKFILIRNDSKSHSKVRLCVTTRKFSIQKLITPSF